MHKEYAAHNNFPCWFDFSPLPMFQIDNGLPLTCDSPVIWGNVDLTAGMRKVNLVFNIIEVFKFIIHDLAEEQSQSRDLLEKLWSHDTRGTTFVFSDGLVRGIFSDFNSKFNWNVLHSSAKTNFPNDYTGERIDTSHDAILSRMQWIYGEIFARANYVFNYGKANVIINALRDLFFLFNNHRIAVGKDHDYAHYVIHYNSTIRRFHSHLIDLILA